MRPIPEVLRGRAFSRADALGLGVTDRMLEGSRFVRIHSGVYRTRDTEPTLPLLVDAALLALPPGAAVSHMTNIRLRGLDVRSDGLVHVATRRESHRRLVGVRQHRFRGRLLVEAQGGRPLLAARRTFVDCATILHESELVRLGDGMVARGLTTPEELWAFCIESHLDGVQRARIVAPWVRSSVASPRESDVRWKVVEAGLPEPEVNAEIYNDAGDWLARGDLVFREWKVVVEYDGWQHERDQRQRQSDIWRRERLEAAGWRVIVITAGDFQRPSTIASRVRQALRQAGARV